MGQNDPYNVLKTKRNKKKISQARRKDIQPIECRAETGEPRI